MKVQDRPSVLIGLIGSGITHSLTPAMHEREGDQQGIRYLYRTIDLEKLGLGVDDLPSLLDAAERMGFTGLNITHPCKQAVVGLLDELSEVAAKIGAVNTVVFSGGRRIGHNTDAWGFMESFREEIAGQCPHDQVVLIGAGGAGTAVAHALLTHTQCRLAVMDLDSARAAGLVSRLQEYYGRDRAKLAVDLAQGVTGANGVINATPIGMKLHPGCPLDPVLLQRHLWVADIVYVPMETELVRLATRAGCTVMRGGGMAVYQAVRAFEHFTGIRPDINRMKSHFASLLNLSGSQPQASCSATGT
jgi:shikimate dehydrogenase